MMFGRKTNDVAGMQNDLAGLQRDLDSLLEQLKKGEPSKLRSVAQQVEARASRLYRDMATTENELAAQEGSRRVGEKPLLAMLVALGAGYIGGRFLSR
jgi:ElaB/YqjD/DUF883 family membrane-anchored ribosome-binding protein